MRWGDYKALPQGYFTAEECAHCGGYPCTCDVEDVRERARAIADRMRAEIKAEQQQAKWERSPQAKKARPMQDLSKLIDEIMNQHRVKT